MRPQPPPRRRRARLGLLPFGRLPALQKNPLEQLFRDHGLTGCMLAADGDAWSSALYVFLYPEPNPHCARATSDYAACLTDASSFAPLTPERLVATIRGHARPEHASWIDAVAERYLAWERVEGLLENAAPRPPRA